MNYEIVTLEEKLLAGYTARTSNDDPEMNMSIAGLWKRLFEGGAFFTMKNKADDHSIGLYSDYENGPLGKYSITVGCAVTSDEALPEDMIAKRIPGGRYAKFSLACGMDTAGLGKAWQEIWATPLDRAFTGDFEEYYNVDEAGNSDVDIFIALK